MRGEDRKVRGGQEERRGKTRRGKRGEDRR